VAWVLLGLVAACNAILGNEEGTLGDDGTTGGAGGEPSEGGVSGSARGGSSGSGARGGSGGSDVLGGTSGTSDGGSDGGSPDGTGGVAGDAGAPDGGVSGTAGSGGSGAAGGRGGMAGGGVGGNGGAGGNGGRGGNAGNGGSGGGCNQVCNSINGTANCTTGTCMLTCTTNFANVDNMGVNGCEVDLRTNEDNCGRVGNDCFVGACSNGACIGRKLVFATSTAVRGSFGGLAGGDALCQQLADQAALAGTYKAWLSTAASSPSVLARFTHSTLPYVRTDGMRIAANYTALIGVAGLENPINLDQRGIAVTYTNTWTSTKDNGTYHSGTTSAFGDCTSWTVTSGNGVYGRVTALVGWSQFGGALNCDMTYGLYCFQQ
jgi:hypothetical protein